jgi:hypothetical protein
MDDSRQRYFHIGFSILMVKVMSGGMIGLLE